MRRAKTLYRTCIACPAQWEGHLRNGKMFYIRYRHGDFSCRLSVGETDDVMDAVAGDEIFHKIIGDSGWMETEEMIELLENKDIIDFTDVKWESENS